jgi:hypothetical protein
VNVFELAITGIDSDAKLADLRWQLFVCKEVADVRRTEASDVVKVLYDGEQPDLSRWRHVLEAAGYELGSPAAGDHGELAA